MKLISQGYLLFLNPYLRFSILLTRLHDMYGKLLCVASEGLNEIMASNYENEVK